MTEFRAYTRKLQLDDDLLVGRVHIGDIVELHGTYYRVTERKFNYDALGIEELSNEQLEQLEDQGIALLIEDRPRETSGERLSTAEFLAGLDFTESLRQAGKPWPEADDDGNLVMRDASEFLSELEQQAARAGLDEAEIDRRLGLEPDEDEEL